MILAADVNCASGLAGQPLRLEVAFQAKVVVALNEHFVVHAAVRIMTRRAALADGFVFKDERPALCDMTLHAGVAFGRE